MLEVKRNDMCPCGSGKKYKKCCKGNAKQDVIGFLDNPTFLKVIEYSKGTILEYDLEHERALEIKRTYISVLENFGKNPTSGACHFLSVMLYILLQEQEINCNIMIGEVEINNIRFSHSWVEIDNQVYDIAILFPNKFKGCPPVFANIDIETQNHSKVKYGITKKLNEKDRTAQMVFQMSVSGYLDGHPEGKHVLWDEILLVRSILIGGYVKLNNLREKYSSHKRQLKVPTY